VFFGVFYLWRDLGRNTTSAEDLQTNMVTSAKEKRFSRLELVKGSILWRCTMFFWLKEDSS